MYAYGFLTLIDQKRDFTEMDGTEEIQVTSAEVCLNFRHVQEEGHVMCIPGQYASTPNFSSIVMYLR